VYIVSKFSMWGIFISFSAVVVIGFNQTSYSISEQQGSVDVVFQIVSGSLGTSEMFNFTTFSGSAIGK